MKTSCGILSIGLSLTAACGGGENGGVVAPRPLPNGSAPTDTAIITVATGSPGAIIPADFLGFSYEVTALRDTQLTNPAYAAAAALLGPGIVRFGGNSVDKSTWSPSPPGGDDSDLTGIDFDRGFTFARAAGWTMYLGINLGHFEPDTFAAEARYAVDRPGAPGVLAAIEIGNEPDVFNGSYRSEAYNGDSIAADYAAYDVALTSQAPGIPRVGPAMCCKPTDFLEFLSTGGSRGLLLLTYHHYPTSATNNPTPGTILSPGLMAKSAALIDEVVADAQTAALPLRMAESNSASSEGKHGTSDVFASSLWGLDYLYTLAEHGAVGVNFHGSPAGGIYSPLIDSGGVVARPLFYAMLAFHAGAIGAVVPATIATPINVTAHATLAGNGTLRVTVINKDTLNAVLARIAPASASPFRSATGQFLTAPSIHTEYGVTFAGTAVSSSGTWTAGVPYAIPGAHGTFTVPVSAASAVVVTLSP
jgi:glycosyl hydrolase family 79